MDARATEAKELIIKQIKNKHVQLERSYAWEDRPDTWERRKAALSGEIDGLREAWHIIGKVFNEMGKP